ncbi:MAG: hypothetical protein HYZ45_02900 [Burkholderiales bacterium]|nr:hypothetical protein [Burkholderiales bacterium]
MQTSTDKKESGATIFAKSSAQKRQNWDKYGTNGGKWHKIARHRYVG